MSSIVWGAAAAGVIGATMAYALEQRRKRKQEEARQRAEAMEEAARRNAEREAAKVRNWLEAEAKRKEAALLEVRGASMDAKVARLEEQEGTELQAKKDAATMKVSTQVSGPNIGKILIGVGLILLGLLVATLGAMLIAHGIAECITVLGCIVGVHEIAVGIMMFGIGAGIVYFGGWLIYQGLSGK